MATTIKLKNGSGAPLAGDLVQGEPALDLTNKRLYTEDSGGTVIEVGTNPTSLTTGTFTSTGIDDNATSTAITIDASENVGIGTTSPQRTFHVSSGATNVVARLESTDATSVLEFKDDSGTAELGCTGNNLVLSPAGTERMRIDAGGSVLIGKTTPTDLHNTWNHLIIGEKGAIISENGAGGIDGITIADNAYIDADTGSYAYQTTAAASKITQTGGVITFDNAGSGSAGAALTLTERMRIDASGNVGIGTTGMTQGGGGPLQVYSSAGSQLILGKATGAPSISFGSTTTQYGLIEGINGGGFTFYTGNGTLGNRLVIDASGNVGIGTSSPSQKLDVKGNIVSDSGSLANGLVGLGSASHGIRRGSDVTLDDENDVEIFSAGSNPSIWLTPDTATGQGLYGVRQDGLHRWYNSGGRSGGSEVMRIDSSGNVGIGTSSPSALLDLVGGVASPLVLELNSANSNCDITMQSASTSSVTRLRNGTNDFQVHTNGTERMRIDSSGKVGIGTTSPTTLLEVEQNSTSGTTGSFPEITATNTNAAGVAGFRANGANGAVAFQLAALTDRARISTLTNYPMTFLTNSAERMRIDSSGNLLVGVTTNTSGNGATGKLNVRQDSTTTTTAPMLAANEAGSGSLIIFSGNGGGVGTSNRIYHGGSAVVYGTSSDERLKKNITSAPSALAILNSVEAVSFDWKATDQHTKYGFIAQQFVDVVPDAVIKGSTDDEPWGMDYGKVTPFLLKAIQEQQAMIEELKAEVAALKGA